MARELNFNELEAVTGGLTRTEKQNLLEDFNRKKTDIDYDYDFDSSGCGREAALERLKQDFFNRGLDNIYMDRIINNENYTIVYNSVQGG